MNASANITAKRRIRQNYKTWIIKENSSAKTDKLVQEKALYDSE